MLETICTAVLLFSSIWTTVFSSIWAVVLVRGTCPIRQYNLLILSSSTSYSLAVQEACQQKEDHVYFYGTSSEPEEGAAPSSTSSIFCSYNMASQRRRRWKGAAPAYAGGGQSGADWCRLEESDKNSSTMKLKFSSRLIGFLPLFGIPRLDLIHEFHSIIIYSSHREKMNLHEWPKLPSEIDEINTSKRRTSR